MVELIIEEKGQEGKEQTKVDDSRELHGSKHKMGRVASCACGNCSCGGGGDDEQI